jgi:hypothetical protein
MTRPSDEFLLAQAVLDAAAWFEKGSGRNDPHQRLREYDAMQFVSGAFIEITARELRRLEAKYHA